jgi:hypothetical protein
MPHKPTAFFLVLIAFFVVHFPAQAQPVRLPVTADIWLSDASAGERNSSMGAAPRFKLKFIQELAALRFDVSAIAGREVKSARLYLRKAGDDKLRYLRVSTVNQDWVEGRNEKPYGRADGATWFYADSNSKKSWAWPSSAFCDVVMSSGHSIASYAEIRREKDGWISVEVAPALIYAMVAKDTDGLAVMDGGNLSLFNNLIYSREQNASAPYLQVETGDMLKAIPKAPIVKAEPSLSDAHLKTGAMWITIEPDPAAACYRITLDGHPAPRWQIPHPTGKTMRIILDDLVPDKKFDVEVTAVAASGQVSAPTRVIGSSSTAAPPPPELNKPSKPALADKPLAAPGVYILPPLVKISPDTAKPLNADVEANFASVNSVWSGNAIHLAGAKGEYVDFQVFAPGQQPAIIPGEIDATTGNIHSNAFELYSLNLAKNHDKKLQPAYAIPLRPGESSKSPFIHVDVFIPKDAVPGHYNGTLKIKTDREIKLPIEIEVYKFALPEKLTFWPELNAYSIPKNHLDYFRLAQQNRCVANFWRFEPRVRGKGEAIKVDWSEYDRDVGPLLSGDAFKANHRAGVPVECMYLPFDDNWPTNLSKETYHYAGYWPHKGDNRSTLVEHSMTAPPIDHAFSADYLAAFASVQKQFIQHFQEKRWSRTEMQCFFGTKQTHRINYGSNHWWTTDEPSFLHDWLALRYFDGLWINGHTPAPFVTRADISRPQWQGEFLDGVTQVIYYGAGASSAPDQVHRIHLHERETPLKVRFYGGCNPDNQSNLATVAWILDAYLNGADGVLPWQTLGKETALDDNDASAFGGNALLIPATRFNQPVVADVRLKAMRDAEQVVEYLNLVAQKRHLNREQLEAMVAQHLSLSPASAPASPTADTDSFKAPKAWQINELKRALAELIEN